jgi:flavin reductase (DIM6/NTAB) family NADH-FMN oxidoreductase RutF
MIICIIDKINLYRGGIKVFQGKKNMGARTYLFPTPIVLCGTYDKDGNANLAALAWAGVCCSEPPAVQISVRPERHTHAAIVANREFTVCLPSSDQAAIADFCGMVSGRSVDKLGRAGITSERGEFVNAPVIREFPVCLECRLIGTLALGSHDLFVGEVLASWIEEKYLGENGNIDLPGLSPMAYAPLPGGGEYYKIGSSVGKSFNIGRLLADKK